MYEAMGKHLANDGNTVFSTKRTAGKYTPTTN
jgi:hypothetical protein